MPVEHLINKRYLKKAKAKLLQNKELIKIAVTGSYGKTSTKNIITNILENKYLTLKTPISNTATSYELFKLVLIVLDTIFRTIKGIQRKESKFKYWY